MSKFLERMPAARCYEGNWPEGLDKLDQRDVPPGRFELPPLPPEGSALSPELWGPRCVHKISSLLST